MALKSPVRAFPLVRLGHPSLQSILFAGGGITGGQIVGSSDEMGGYPKDNPKTPEDVAAAIFDALAIPRHATYHDITDRPHPVYLG